MGPKVRQAFGIVFDTRDNESLELVRRSGADSWVGSGVGRYNRVVELKEVK
jgi:hypothetical protein